MTHGDKLRALAATDEGLAELLYKASNGFYDDMGCNRKDCPCYTDMVSGCTAADDERFDCCHSAMLRYLGRESEEPTNG